jgi:uncharacterized membrane protein
LLPTGALHSNRVVPGRIVVGALAVAAVAWFALVVLAPDLPPALAAVVYAAGGFVCHQLPERSFHWHGAQLAVCARCTGIYLGACSAAVLAPLPPAAYAGWAASRARAATLLAAGAVPMVVTVAAEWTGLWQPSSIVRAATGVLLGVAAALVVAAALGPGGGRGRSGALHYDECLPRAADAQSPPHTRSPRTPT